MAKVLEKRVYLFIKINNSLINNMCIIETDIGSTCFIYLHF